MTYEEIKRRQEIRRRILTEWVAQYKKPDWYAWFLLYPAQASVRAAEAELKAMDRVGV